MDIVGEGEGGEGGDEQCLAPVDMTCDAVCGARCSAWRPRATQQPLRMGRPAVCVTSQTVSQEVFCAAND